MATKNSAPAEKPAIDLSKCLCFTPEGMARQLENYTHSVFRVVEEYQVLYGSAVSVRKAMDSMGAYLITRHTEGGEINPPTDGIDTNSNSSILNRLRQAAKSKQVIRPFITLWEQILPDRKSKMTGLQTLFHYQPVSAASEEDRREEEKENLKLDYRIFFDHLITYKKLVRQFLSIAGDVDTVINNNKEEFRSLNALRSEPDDPAWDKEQNDAERNDAIQNAVSTITGIYSGGNDPDPWLNWHCLILEKYSQRVEDQLARDLCALICRKIGERTTRQFLLEVNPGMKFDSRATYEDYLQKCERLKSSEADDHQVAFYHRMGKVLAAGANDCLHWHAADNEHLKPFSPNRQRVYKSEILWHAAEIVLGKLIDEHPEHAFRWYSEINNLNLKTDKQRDRELEEARNDLAKLRKQIEIERIKRRNLIITLSIVCFIVILLGGFLVSNHLKHIRETEITTRYYANYTWRYGVPEGVGEITSDEADTRAHYEFDLQNEKIVEVRLTDAKGCLMDEIIESYQGRSSLIRIDYSRDRADKVSFYNADRAFLLTLKYEYDPDTYEITGIKFQDQSCHALFLPYSTTGISLDEWLGAESSRHSPTISKVSGLTVRETEDGRIREITYGWDDNVSDGNGVSGASLLYNPDGMVESVTYQYSSGSNRESGILIRKFRYAGTLLTEEETVDTAGTSKTIRYTWNEQGNCIAEAHTDSLNTLVADQRGLAKVTYGYSPAGRVTETGRYGADGKPLAADSGWAVTSCTWDDSGRELTRAYLDAFGNPVAVNGWARRVSKYEETPNGTRRTISWFDEKGQPGIQGQGYASEVITITREGSGRVLLYERYQADGETRVLYDGAYQKREKEDQYGNLVEIEMLDSNGRLMVSEKLQFARKINKYDHRRLTEEAYYDERGVDYQGNRYYTRRTIQYTPSGQQEYIRDYYLNNLVIQEHFVYDKGNIIRDEYLDRSGKLRRFNDDYYAYMEIKYTPSEKGTVVRTEYHDTDGSLMMVSNATGTVYACREDEYDRNDYWIGETLYDDRGDKVYSPETGCYTLIKERDGRGNETAVEFRDRDGRLMFSGIDLGYARMERKYNSNNQVTEETFYNTENNLYVNSKAGYARCLNLYSEQTGRFLGTEFYDEKGNLVLSPEHGYAKTKCEYDVEGNFIRETLYGEDGKPRLVPERGYAEMRVSYEDGAPIVKRYFEANRIEISGEIGITKKTSFFNEKGERIVNEKEGYSAAITVCDNKGLNIGLLYLDETDRPMIRRGESYAFISRIQNEQGQITEERYFGADGSPVLHSTGASGYRWTYDEDGNVASTVALDAYGRPVESPEEEWETDTAE